MFALYNTVVMTAANHLYAISFTAGADSGLALVAACSKLDAEQVLRSAGRKREVPESYVIRQIDDLGVSTTLKCDLVMETQVNAVTAWDLIEEKMALICNCDGRGGSPTPIPDDYVRREELDAYATIDYVNQLISSITPGGGSGEMNTIERIYVNGEEVVPVRKNVSLTVPTKVSQLNNDADFSSKAYVQSYVAQYVDEHSGGDTPSAPSMMPIVETTSSSQSMQPNKYYVWTSPITSMAFTLDTSGEVSGYVSTYQGEFTVSSAGMSSFTLPQGVVVADQYFYELTPSEYFHPLATYQFSILRNVMSIYSSYIPA